MWPRPARLQYFASSAVNFSVAMVLVGAGVLAAANLLLVPVEAMQEAVGLEPASSARSSRTVAAHELPFIGELLGGFRGPVADLLWLEANERAEAGDLPAMEELLHLVTSVDPRPLYFWLNAARITAYDVPARRVASMRDERALSSLACRRIEEDQARRALDLLDEARRYHPACAALWIEQANIQLNRLGDVAGAAESYRRAVAQPDAPYFAARLHAELLRRLGRKDAALAWLVRLHPTLPRWEEAAGADLVLSRIRTLERELGVPAERAYHGL